MEIFICDEASDFPPCLRGHAHECALQFLADDEYAPVVVARRADGDVQVVPEGHLDAEVIANLLKWAAGARP